MPAVETAKVYPHIARYGNSVVKGSQLDSSILYSKHSATSKSSGKKNRRRLSIQGISTSPFGKESNKDSLIKLI